MEIAIGLMLASHIKGQASWFSSSLALCFISSFLSLFFLFNRHDLIVTQPKLALNLHFPSASLEHGLSLVWGNGDWGTECHNPVLGWGCPASCPGEEASLVVLNDLMPRDRMNVFSSVKRCCNLEAQLRMLWIAIYVIPIFVC